LRDFEFESSIALGDFNETTNNEKNRAMIRMKITMALAGLLLATSIPPVNCGTGARRNPRRH
jgi:hypothetical protein